AIYPPLTSTRLVHLLHPRLDFIPAEPDHKQVPQPSRRTVHTGEGPLATGSRGDPAHCKKDPTRSQVQPPGVRRKGTADQGRRFIDLFNYMIQIALAPVSALPCFHRVSVSGLLSTTAATDQGYPQAATGKRGFGHAGGLRFDRLHGTERGFRIFGQHKVPT